MLVHYLVILLKIFLTTFNILIKICLHVAMMWLYLQIKTGLIKLTYF